MYRDPLLYLHRCLELAAKGRLAVTPNPMVGALVVRDGQIVGEGYHARVGGAHAERVALDAAGEAARGATLYVNLEPCDHHGRTPPCTQAILEAGIAEVIACHRDPHPDAAGGFERLRAAGVRVSWGQGVEEAVRLNARFLVAAREGRPAVTLKWAMSLDGKIATREGHSQWISSPQARRWSLDLREEHDAILVGSGTVLADDPRLTRRPPPERQGTGPIARVILDRRLRTPPTARLLDEPGATLVYARRDVAEAHHDSLEDARKALEERGAEVILLPADVAGEEPRTVLDDLAGRGIGGVLVEGGGGVHAAFVEAGLWDRVVVDAAPLLIGSSSAPGPLAGTGVAHLDQAPRLEPLEVHRRGPDVILEGFRAGCLQDLSSSLGV